jgi:hypothetical protein
MATIAGSLLAQIAVRPSADKATERAGFPVPEMRGSDSPLSICHRQTLPSLPAESATFPSAESATEVAGLE